MDHLDKVLVSTALLLIFIQPVALGLEPVLSVTGQATVSSAIQPRPTRSPRPTRTSILSHCSVRRPTRTPRSADSLGTSPTQRATRTPFTDQLTRTPRSTTPTPISTCSPTPTRTPTPTPRPLNDIVGRCEVDIRNDSLGLTLDIRNDGDMTLHNLQAGLGGSADGDASVLVNANPRPLATLVPAQERTLRWTGELFGNGRLRLSVTISALDETGAAFAIPAIDCPAIEIGSLSPTLPPTPTPTPQALACAGDCDENGAVAVSEIVQGVRITMGQQTLASCPQVDESGDGVVDIGDITRAVRNALDGCPG